MSLNPTGVVNYNWNYSNPSKDGYSTSLTGTCVAIQEVQKRTFSNNGYPGQPEFWPDGNPKMNIRMAFALPDGSLKTFTFQPASKAAKEGKKKSIHMELFHLTNDTDMNNLIGKTITISTQEAPTGFAYGAGSPRPWQVKLETEAGPFNLAQPLPTEFTIPALYANDGAHGGQPAVQQQPVVQTQPVVQSQPQGMDPAIAAAMAQMGATVVEVTPGPVQGTMYGTDDIPWE